MRSFSMLLLVHCKCVGLRKPFSVHTAVGHSNRARVQGKHAVTQPVGYYASLYHSRGSWGRDFPKWSWRESNALPATAITHPTGLAKQAMALTRRLSQSKPNQPHVSYSAGKIRIYFFRNFPFFFEPEPSSNLLLSTSVST